MNPSQPQSVGIILNNTGGYSRGVLRGVASFAAARGWELHVHGLTVDAVDIDSWAVHGLIVQASSDSLVNAVRARGLPAVNISSSTPPGLLPTVGSDDRAIGRLAADDLLRRGFRSLACYADTRGRFARLRAEGFEHRAAEADLVSPAITCDASTLRQTLVTAAKPLGVLATNDLAALSVLQACRELSLEVPDSVAVLGVDNDELIQALSVPPLSSIAVATERIGFEAASLLQKLMTHPSPPPPPLLIPPLGVITRQSTDVLAIEDPAVRDAIRFIRSRSAEPIDVPRVASAVHLSRRQLERRFRAVTGRSVLDELRRSRLERAKGLLGDTDLTIEQIATASGFRSPGYLAVVFGSETGLTPTAYRRLARTPPAGRPPR